MLGKKSLLLLELFYIKNVSLFLTILSMCEGVDPPPAAGGPRGSRDVTHIRTITLYTIPKKYFYNL